MAVNILGYRIDPAFMAFFSFVFKSAKRFDWTIHWSNESSDMLGTGLERFGQAHLGGRTEGISISLLKSRTTNALGAAQKAGRRRYTVLFATATAAQREKLPAADRMSDKGYVIIKNGSVPELSEYPNAVLVWGNGWSGDGSEARIMMLFDELVRTFIFPDEGKPVLPDPPAVNIPISNERDELVG